MKKKGIALILVLAVILVLVALGGIMFSRSLSESWLSTRHLESVQAFWLAEAGVSRAMNELRNNYNQFGPGLWPTPLGQGGYFVDVVASGTLGQERGITAHGFIPFNPPHRAERIIEVNMIRVIPPDFFDNAIYSAGDVQLNGNAYEVNGDVIYSGGINDTGGITGSVTDDPTISPLARLDFTELRNIAIAQGNLYTAADLAAGTPFPAVFFNSPGIPNVVYIEGDLILNGNIGTIGGFYVVAGDVINTPNAAQEAFINGNGSIEGAIYTRGEFRVNGGGGQLNINGGVWAGDLARLNGNTAVNYNATYMDAIAGLNITADVQISSWRDTQTIYSQ